MSSTAGWWPLVAAEYLKLKRTLVPALALVIPVAPPFFSFMIGLLKGGPFSTGGNPWETITSVSLQLWSVMMLPFVVALQTSLAAQLENANNQWKNLYALPLSRARLYVVKWGVTASLLLVSTIMLLLYSLFWGALLGFLKPEMGLLKTAPAWGSLPGAFMRPFLAVQLLLALHAWISYRWPSLAVALGIAVVGMTGVIAVVGSPLWGRLFPWSLPFRVLDSNAPDRTFILLYAFTGSLVVLALGAWDARSREKV
jgi:hypothetical protein